MKEGDFVTVSLAIGLDHQYLIEVNNPENTGIFNITLEEKLKERCMKWGADHSIITTSGYIRILMSHLVSINCGLAFSTILLFCRGKLECNFTINGPIDLPHNFLPPLTPVV